MFHGKYKHTIIWLQTFTKNNIEPHENITGSYKKIVEVLDELQGTQNIKMFIRIAKIIRPTLG